MTDANNLLGIPETTLPEDPAGAELLAGGDPALIAGRNPASALAWATLAEAALATGFTVEAYAYARTGYHRSLDQLRKAGWRGQGPVPWSHEPNRGFLRALAALSRAAGELGETDEQARCAQFLRDSSPEAADALGL
ncbi:hypothetical protein BJY21_001074 [Kineosphaera limosa]|uniref:DUF3151 domain-containing protein n=1 Tax=Kineosphaera limosa NBRC 100340 TaxID=1184609 RepID=K6X9Q7_9MICO|nr:DUF3151 domain-containing protein [Kineosphaera limosa]NYD99889.1 hypothetical protein [Kineosphaera limosa]GAB95574.1 hypothetical protein KILIM_022_00600 [Kineosphaera limosa NBRC 100340]